ncbi:PREDICTED: stromal cell-derived factor 2-like [Amphimedon queenslandica]|uniref:MIR domain-containing protein n=1 Tax=Amphimedon queenslandica TaxID=400682 RepID=A0A1X7UD50_AMPQE|nr:PREDICTED: stromal cell-derived factor 2-like [Amphimedon queenslandica]|eukprot:XP_003388356.1 PREDICTED: stromal cell-derived factor 2-like [Amphimedon queenslandica]
MIRYVLLFLLCFVPGAYLDGFQHVTCKSVIKLLHKKSNVRLHSHDVKYGSGSGQQSITGVTNADDVNSYWIVHGPHGQICERGNPVKCGSGLRLQHLSTQKFLHSHHFNSPLSGNQEVSGFGDGNGGDTGDNWILECSDDYWRRDGYVRFKHQDTNVYLHSTGHTYGRPIEGQHEISGHKYVSDNNLWKAMEGVYMEPASKS